MTFVMGGVPHELFQILKDDAVESAALNMQYAICRLPANCLSTIQRLPWWYSNKESAYNAGAAGDTGLIPELGRSPGEGHGNPLQYSCLENPMDRGAW